MPRTLPLSTGRRRACTGKLGDRWQEALAAIHLADAAAALGLDDTSREDAAHALAPLQEFTDDQAAALKADLQARLA